MDAMLLGETLAGETGARFVGYWMPAGGNYGVAAIQVFHAELDAKDLIVTIETKSSDDDDAAPNIDAIGVLTITSATPQVHRFEANGAKDLVRYAVELGGDEQAVHFQLLQPTWAAN